MSAMPHWRDLVVPHKSLFWFLIGAASIAVIGGAVYGLLFEWFFAITGNHKLLANVVVFAIGVSVLLGAILTLKWGVRITKPVHPRNDTPRPRRGLILLVSTYEACRSAIEHHRTKLERIWLICSQKTEEDALRLQSDFPEQTRDITPIRVDDINDPLAYFRAVDRIYSSLPEWLPPSEVISDYTGMTKNASVGMAMSSFLNPERPLEYVLETRDRDGSRGSTPPIEILLKF